MKIHIIGCGNAFSKKSGHQSFLLEENGEYLLIDDGSRVPLDLWKLGFEARKINTYYISHIHDDHVNGLGEHLLERYDFANFPRRWDDFKTDSYELEFFTGLGKKIVQKIQKEYWKPNTYKPYAPKLIAHEKVMADLWNKTLSGAMETTQGFTATLETWVEPQTLKDNENFEWQGWNFELVQQIHIVAGNTIKHAFGLLMSKAGHKTVYFTTDTQYLSPEQMETFYIKADIIIQDVECGGVNMKFPEGALVYKDKQGVEHLYPTDATDPDGMQRLALAEYQPYAWKRFMFSSKVHANFAKIAGYDSANSTKLTPAIRAKMKPSHYPDLVVDGVDGYGNKVDWDAEFKAAGFDTRIKQGDTIEV
jgi:hypothetical protein